MASIINTNLMSINAQRHLSGTQSNLAVTMQRLSSGLRVNSSKDDAAGLSIATRMDAQVRGMNVAIRNANDGISFAQTAEAAIGSATDSLQRMRELAVQARNDTNQGKDIGSLGEEYQKLAEEIGRVLQGTKFNGASILANSSSSMNFQVGANVTTHDVINVEMTNLVSNSAMKAVIGSTATMIEYKKVGSGSSATMTATSFSGLGTIIKNIDAAIDTINSERSKFGAVQARFDAVITNLQSAVENQSAARSRIMDADFAAETANLSRSQVLQQAGNAMVAMANQMPMQVLQLLG